MRKLLLALALLAASTGTAYAGPAPRAHDGLLLQLDLGGGAFSSEMDDADDTKFSGGAAQFSFTLGGAVRENLVLGGQLWLTTASEPDVENSLGEGTLDATMNLVGIGPNITYYFMPVNIYLSATPSFTRLTIDGDQADGSTDGGFGLRLAVGKDWFLGDNFGLGVNLNAAWASNDDQDNGPTFKSSFYGLAVSATFN